MIDFIMRIKINLIWCDLFEKVLMKYLIGSYYVEVEAKRYLTHSTKNINLGNLEEWKSSRIQLQVPKNT